MRATKNLICFSCQIQLTSDNWLPSQQKKNRHLCSSCLRQENNLRYQKRKEIYLLSYKAKRHLIKQQVLSYYGNQCQLCHDNNFYHLSLDHLFKNGRQHRKSLKKNSSSAFYAWTLKHKPDFLRILCFNCNCQTNDVVLTNNFRHNQRLALKIEVLSFYGGKCKNCQVNQSCYLTIDHLLNNGANHRRQIGSNIYPWLKANYFPSEYQVLCYNCNYEKYLTSKS